MELMSGQNQERQSCPLIWTFEINSGRCPVRIFRCKLSACNFVGFYRVASVVTYFLKKKLQEI